VNPDPHVVPENDLNPHVLSSGCACKPRFVSEGGAIITVHNAFDGREHLEEIFGVGRKEFPWVMYYMKPDSK